MRCANSPFVLDLRALGCFRVLLGVVILLDQMVRIGEWRAFHSIHAVVSLEDSQHWDSPFVWSLYWLSNSALLPYILEAGRFVATMTLLLGIRSRLSAFVLFVLLASVAARNPLLLQGGDRVLVVMTFFAMFLPLGQRMSFETLWFAKETNQGVNTHQSAATVAYVVQILLVWFMAGILKTGEQWTTSGTAISMALHLEAFVTEFARLWRDWDWATQPMTRGIFWLECLAPWLVLIPLYWCRITGLAALVALEIGIWLTLEVGLFPLISIVSLVPLVPHRTVDTYRRWITERFKKQSTRLVLFFDADCRFCLFACRFLLAACAIRDAHVREAQSDPGASKILDEHFSWSATVQEGEKPEQIGADAPTYHRGWDAVRLVVNTSPRPWIGKLIPAEKSGERFYGWIAKHRGAIGSSGQTIFGSRPAHHVGRAGTIVVSAALAGVLAWNVVTYPALTKCTDLRDHVRPFVGTFNLLQYWDMFAPNPYVQDNWHVMPALSRDGTQSDLLTGNEITFETPRDGPDHYGGYRWRKIIIRSLQLQKIERVFRYFCRTDQWAAIDLWEFSRPNTGGPRTAGLPYSLTRAGRWHCEDVDQSAVNQFRADIDERMLAHGRAK